MKAILDRVTMGLTGRADVHDPVVVETDEEISKQVQEAAVQARATHTHVNLHVTDWVAAQQEDPVLNHDQLDPQLESTKSEASLGG